MPWHLPYNRGKSMEKPQLGHPKGARVISAQHDSFGRLDQAQTALFKDSVRTAL
jgi:hypothetical protein